MTKIFRGRCFIKWGEGGGDITNSNIIKDLHSNAKIYFPSFLQKLSFVCVGKVPRGLGLDSDSLGIAHLASHALDTYLSKIQ